MAPTADKHRAAPTMPIKMSMRLEVKTVSPVCDEGLRPRIADIAGYRGIRRWFPLVLSLVEALALPDLPPLPGSPRAVHGRLL